VRLLACAAALATLAASRSSAAEPSAPPTPPAVGTVVPDFRGKDSDGVEFSLAAARSLTSAQALEAVLAAARESGRAEAAATDALDAVPGVRGDDGATDVARRAAFLRRVGRPHGLLPSPEGAKALTTLGDAAEWLSRAATAPILFVQWSPVCPYVKGYDDRVQALAAEFGTRLYAVSSNAPVTDGQVKKFVADRGTPYRVLVDRRQEIADLLGGRHTPEAILLDAKNVLRYRGGIDDDPLETRPEAERARWLRDALAAVRDGKEVARPTTTPLGCPVRR
jgi:hypothetical protein